MSDLTTSAPEAAAAAVPAIRVSGNPTPEEVAALVVVLSALGGEEPAPEHARSAWSDPSWRLVGPSRTRDGWRTSGLPR